MSLCLGVGLFFMCLFYRVGDLLGVMACEMTKVFFAFVFMALDFRASVTKVFWKMT